MITIQLTINGINLTQYVKYPISFTQKNLDESLNLLELSLYATEIETPFKPNTVATIIITDGNVEWFNGQMLLSGDTVDRVGVTNKYHHRMSFIELTYLLSLEILPDMTITRVTLVPEGQIGSVYEPTLADVVDKILAISEGNFSKGLTLGAATRNILAATQAPELTLTRYTTLEALRLVFGIAKIVPYIQFTNFLNHIGVTSIQTTLPNFAAKSEAYNTEQFRTRLYSPVENFIGGGDLEGSIVEPALGGWLTTRSLGDTDIKADAVSWKLTRPIYKVESLKLKTYLFLEKIEPSEVPAVRVVVVPIELQANAATWFGIDSVDLVSLGKVYEKATYDLLQNTNAGKGSNIYYEQGKKQILGLSNKPETWSDFWAPEDQAIRQIIKDLGTTPIQPLPAYEAAFNSYMQGLYTAQFGNDGYVIQGKGLVVDGSFGHFDSTQYLTYTGLFLGQSPRRTGVALNYGALRARITYTPYINTKLITYKERKETGDPVYQTTMFYNQSANTVSDEVLAELHDKVIKRGNAPTQTLKKIHTSLSQIPPLGRLVANYVITAEDITIMPEHATVEYILSKDYAKLNQYVAVLEKYRQFAIPNEQVVDRQFTINEFAKFSRTSVNKSASLAVASYVGTNEANLMTVNTSATYKLPGDNTTYSTPIMAFATTNFAFNNSLVFEMQFVSNAAAGSESILFTTNNNANLIRRLERPIPYVDNTGYFQTITSLQLGTNIASQFSLTDSYEYPIFTGEALASIHLTRALIPINKDARERLSISYILHHIDETQKVYLNPGWALRNGLIGGPGYTGLRFAYFNLRPIDGLPGAGNYSVVGASPNINISSTSERVMITHTSASVQNANYWGVIDENSDLLFWVDEPCVAGIAPAPLYINFSNTY
jgi:hypothetical protein